MAAGNISARVGNVCWRKKWIYQNTAEGHVTKLLNTTGSADDW